MSAEPLLIRPATRADEDAIWALLQPAIAAGEHFSYTGDEPRELVLADWMKPGTDTFVASFDGIYPERSRGAPSGRSAQDDKLVGAYYLRANYRGRGAHVANAGYAVAPAARGRGIARAMCEHSVARARERGFHSIVFNYVVSTNAAALAVWKSCGFAVVGTIPGAFSHPEAGLVDVHIMHRFV